MARGTFRIDITLSNGDTYGQDFFSFIDAHGAFQRAGKASGVINVRFVDDGRLLTYDEIMNHLERAVA